MDTTDSSLIFAVAVIIGLIWATGMVLLLAIAWQGQILTDWVTRDRSQPYWRRPRGPVGPLSGASAMKGHTVKTPGRVALAIQMRAAGFLPREIADHFDISVSAADQWVRDPNGTALKACRVTA